MQTSGRSRREKAKSCLEAATQAPHPRCRPPRKRGTQYAAASRLNHYGLWNTGSPSPELANAFVRRRTSAVKRLRRGSAVLARRSFSEGGSRRRQGKGLNDHCLDFPPRHCEEHLRRSNPFYFFTRPDGLLRAARNDNGMRVRAPRWLGMTTGWPRRGGAARAGAEPTPGTGPGNPAPPRKRPDWLHFPPLSSFLVTSP